MNRRILVVEDDPGLARVLCDNLKVDGFTVKWAATAHEALKLCQSFTPDLVLLDVMLPERNGFELCGVLRQGGRRPVIFLTARGNRADKLRGLTLGADDYITKPFDMEELVARINAVLRRAARPVSRIRLGDITIDLQAYQATQNGHELHLTHREYEILTYLAERHDRVVHRDQLLQEVWGIMDSDALTRSVDFAIARLRKKIEPDPANPRFIRTVHGDGYSLTSDQD
jgi:two-component system, OmpR family, response regulator VicR